MSYITDPSFSSDIETIRAHYERLSGVYESLATLGDEYPTLGFAGNDGWYQYTEESDVESIEDGQITLEKECPVCDITERRTLAIAQADDISWAANVDE